MTEQDGTYQQVTVAEAAATLGVSVMTVRRMIRRGQLEGERVHRPQGTAYVVRLPVDAPGNIRDATPTEQPSPNVSRTNATDQSAPAPAEAMVSLIQATIGTVLGPLVGQLDAQRQTIERQAGRVAELERENGRLTAELVGERLKSSLLASTAPESPEPTRGPSPAPWRVLLPWALAILAVAALAVLGAWPR